MHFSDEPAPVYAPDFEMDFLSDDTMFDTDSSSDLSASTITSDQVAKYYRLVNGFLFSVDENNPSILPIHPTSIQIDLLRHTVFRLSRDGENVPPEAARVLRSCQEKGGARILDLMTDTGTCHSPPFGRVQEMAQEYPSATFLSIDAKPLASHKPHPRITFETYDVCAGIAEPDGTFDIVQATNCVTETKNFNFLLREMHRVLKPNGMLVLAKMPFQAFDGELLVPGKFCVHGEQLNTRRNPFVLFLTEPNVYVGEVGSQRTVYRSRWLWTTEGDEAGTATLLQRLIRQALELQGIDLSIWEDVSDRLSPSHPLWNEQSIDPAVELVEPPNNIRGFHTIVQHTRLIPVGSWHEDEAQRMLGSLMRLMVTNLWCMMVPLLCTTGMDEASAQRMVNKALQEFKNDEIRGYTKSHRWSAQKIPL